MESINYKTEQADKQKKRAQDLKAFFEFCMKSTVPMLSLSVDELIEMYLNQE